MAIHPCLCLDMYRIDIFVPAGLLTFLTSLPLVPILSNPTLVLPPIVQAIDRSASSEML